MLPTKPCSESGKQYIVSGSGSQKPIGNRKSSGAVIAAVAGSVVARSQKKRQSKGHDSSKIRQIKTTEELLALLQGLLTQLVRR